MPAPYLCLSLLSDGCCYALKKSRRPVAGSSNEYVMKYEAVWIHTYSHLITVSTSRNGHLVDLLLLCVVCW